MPAISQFIVLVMVHVSAPYSKILSTVERNKFIFNLRGKSDFHMSSFLIAAQACTFLVFMSFSELSTQEAKDVKLFTFLSGFSLARIDISRTLCVVRHVRCLILVYAETDLCVIVRPRFPRFLVEVRIT